MNLKEKTLSAMGENRRSVYPNESAESSKPLEQVETKVAMPVQTSEPMTTEAAIAVIESSSSGDSVEKELSESAQAAQVDAVVAVDPVSAEPVVEPVQTPSFEKAEPLAQFEVASAEPKAVVLTPAVKATTNHSAQEKIIMNAISSLSEKQSTELSKVLDSKSPLYKTESELATAQGSIQLTEDLVNSGRVSSNLHETFEVIGDIVVRGTGASIWGPVTGNIYVEGDGVLYLTQTAKISGNIFARHIVCEGVVEGDIRCAKMIATPNAVLKADIRYSEYFNPAMGADLDGSIKKDPNAMDDIKSPSKKTSGKSSLEKEIASFTS